MRTTQCRLCHACMCVSVCVCVCVCVCTYEYKASLKNSVSSVCIVFCAYMRLHNLCIHDVHMCIQYAHITRTGASNIMAKLEMDFFASQLTTNSQPPRLPTPHSQTPAPPQVWSISISISNIYAFIYISMCHTYTSVFIRISIYVYMCVNSTSQQQV